MSEFRKYAIATILLLSALVDTSIAQELKQSSGRPKIGVTLSGGGAKGLAHIGILKAIDSAGLKVDYITGTSMGSIIGSLYAVGYPADSIEKIVRTIDWELLLGTQSSFRSIFMEEKDEYTKYTLELPWVNHRFHLGSGILEGQELWLKFSELFFPVYDLKKFSQFSIPFRCIGTDVGTGDAVVLKDGEITTAIRASMAIPSVFTAVNLKDKTLIDGGLVRNFPVRDVKEMGADFVIGSNVASGLMPSSKVRNVLQILMQVAFFREAEDNKKEVAQCDLYIPFNMEKYSMGSFSDANGILELGLEQGRKLYPHFKHLADSLDAIYGPSGFRKKRLPEVEKVRISSSEVKGHDKTSAAFFLHTMNFRNNEEYTAKKLANMVRQAYGTRYYSRIVYTLIKLEDGTCRIVFEVKENPLTFAKVGLHYNKFSGVGLIGNFTTRNKLIRNSRSLVSINLGETFRVRGEHLQYMGRQKKVATILDMQFDRFDITTHNEKFIRDGLYRQNTFRFAGKTQFSANRSFTVGLGTRFEWVQYNPILSSGFKIKGSSNFFNTNIYLAHNSLDRAFFPRNGIKIDAEAGWVGRQQENISILASGTDPTPGLPGISTSPYTRTVLNLDVYSSTGKKTTLLLNLQSGINFRYTHNAMNEFIVGGMTRMLRNQITFAGVPEGTLFTPSVVTMQGGLRYQVLGNTYLTGRANVLFTNLISKSAYFNNPDFLSGYSLTFSYNFALGPLEMSAMYCDQTRKIQSYINLGIPF